ncbi:MAG: amidase [Casimicrobiaceae bacterium]
MPTTGTSRFEPVGALGDPGRLTLRAAAAGIRDGRFTSLDLTRAYFGQIDRHEIAVHAWSWIDEDRALACARDADRNLAAGRIAGPLHGVPIAVKDIIYTEGVPTGMGSPIFADFIPTHSAACVQSLVGAGAYVQGKTVTAEFATRHPGATTNPWNAQFTPGGSSSGSAAAVAAGFTAAALGTQTVGSITRPAVYCGVIGYKPSYGLISRFGVHPVSHTLDQVGVLTRTVDDAGFLASLMMGADSRDPATLGVAVPQGLDELQLPARGLRIASVRSPSWVLADARQQALFEANCGALAAGGTVVEALELPARFEDAVRVTRVIQAVEAAFHFKSMMATDADRTSGEFRALFERGLGIPEIEYAAALEARAAMRADLDRMFSSFDVVATPPATGEPPQSIASTGSAEFCAIWTLCGLPSVAFPTGLGAHGLPMGLQVVGRYLDDRHLLQAANWCIQRLPFPFQPKP